MLHSMRVNWRLIISLLLGLLVVAASGGYRAAHAAPFNSTAARPLGSLTATVYDHRGQPISGALVVILRAGAEEIVKEARTGADGKFAARVAAGRYTLRAIAAGFGTANFDSIQITPSSELIYRFNLEPSGDGGTAPEKRKDRNDSKWRLRAAQSRRSIFQVNEGNDQTTQTIAAVEDAVAASDEEATPVDFVETAIRHHPRRPHGLLETFALASENPLARHYAGVNFAIAQSLNDDLDLIFAGQFGAGADNFAMRRVQATARVRVADNHRLNLSAGGTTVNSRSLPAGRSVAGSVIEGGDNSLAQISLRALDEWTVRDGVVVVIGMDYSRLSGPGGSRDAFTPQVGVQYDLNARTRVKAAYTPGSELESVQTVALLEDNRLVFKELPVRQFAASSTSDGQPLLERSSRMEIGVERLLGVRSSVEATAFFDTISDRGIGLMSLPISTLVGAGEAQPWRVVNQQGASRGLRVLYARRLNSALKASAGYSFGRGQSLAAGDLHANFNSPDKIFQNGYFQTVAAQLDARLSART
ncbi:MAG TPA: TonB-dependent receptor, partial [Pyrinomonadaceae bacterium]|nr:TonB-dependent receptor [Pyrinomonadaceae bacterium]